MTQKCTIAVDAMGGDFGLEVTLPACLRFLQQNMDASILLIGHKDAINNAMQANSVDNDRISILHAPDVVHMDESPAHALKNKPLSSMRIAVNAVHEGLADACVSAGNTGALMAIGRYVLKLLPKITRPAIVYSIPTKMTSVAHIHMLDLGANVNCTPDNLVQFAALGSALCQSVDGISNPTVGLLNVGSEANKGTAIIQEAAKLMSANQALNYIGFIESDTIFQRPCDVVVCDGFVGNMVLKTLEGSAKFFRNMFVNELQSTWWTRLKSYMLKNELKSLSHRLNPGNYNGATILGLRGIVVKSHGNAKIDGFHVALNKAMLEAQNNLSGNIMKKVAAVVI